MSSLFMATQLNAYDWELDIAGESVFANCTLNQDPAEMAKKAARGICQKIEEEEALADSKAVLARALLMTIYTDDTTYIRDAAYDEIIKRTGTSFDLGGLATCNLDYTPITKTPLAALCQHRANAVLSSTLVWATQSVDAAGIFGGTGAVSKDAYVSPDKRIYPSGITGDELYKKHEYLDAAGNTHTVQGGYMLGKLVENANGEEARSITANDKASLVLSDFSLKTLKTSNPNAIKLPATKADSIEEVDSAVQALMRLDIDFNEFTDGLARMLQMEYKKEIIVGADCDTMMTLAEYRNKELNVSAEFFKSTASGVPKMYETIIDEAKAKMSTELLMLTTDKDYIFDPSEARLAYISDEYKVAYKYKALIQQEKTKKMQYKISQEAKARKELLDLAKKQAQIKSRIFRDDIAECEIERLLGAVDQTISYTTTAVAAPSPGNPPSQPSVP